MQIVDYGNIFHIYIPFNNFFKRNVEAVKALPDRKWWYEKKVWTVPGSARDLVLQLQYSHRAEIVVPENLKPEMTGEIAPLPELTIDLPIHADLRPYQRNGIARAMELQRCLIGDEQGLGKAQPLSAKIATPAGFIKMADVQIGTELFDVKGRVQKVTGIFPQGMRQAFKITFSDGSTTRCDGDHIWQVRDANRRRRGLGWTLKTTNELLAGGLSYKTNQKRINFGGNPILKWEIPMCEPVRYPEREFVIHPYIMGLLIGDGCMTQNMICVSIPDSQLEIAKRVQHLLPDNLKLRVNRHPACPQYYITQTGTTKANPYKKEIIRLGLNVTSLNKFLPKEYLQGSVEQRIHLLRGLMDSDGSCIKNRTTFHTKSTLLTEGIRELVESLGGQAIIRKYVHKKILKDSPEYQVNIRVKFNPFFLSSKRDEWNDKNGRFGSRYIETIEPDGVEQHQCISVSSAEKLYLTDHFIVTHNTLQSIAAIVGLNAFPCLVICPASTKLNWKREWEKFSSKRAMVLDSSMSAHQKKNWHQYVVSGLADVVIINYESLNTFCIESFPNERTRTGKRKPWHSKDVVLKASMSIFKSGILDESHRCKDDSTNQAKFILRIFNSLLIRILLSGTPLVNKPKDLYPQLAIMGHLQTFGGKKGFLDRYCEGGTGANNLKELNYLLNKHCFFRREKKDVAKDLPEKFRQTIVCDITTRREYDIAVRDLSTWLTSQGYTGEQIDRRLRGEVLTKIAALKQISARGKLNEVKEFVQEVLDSGEKLIVFCSLYEIVDAMRRMFPDSVTVTGRDNTEQKQANIDRFQRDPKCQLIICNIKAAGVGITLTASSRVAFIEYPWTYADCVQCEDRAHRIGQVNNVTCTYFLGNNTIDEQLFELIQSKRHVANTVTGATDMMEMEEINKVFDNLFKTTIHAGSAL